MWYCFTIFRNGSQRLGSLLGGLSSNYWVLEKGSDSCLRCTWDFFFFIRWIRIARKDHSVWTQSTRHRPHTKTQRYFFCLHIYFGTLESTPHWITTSSSTDQKKYSHQQTKQKRKKHNEHWTESFVWTDDEVQLCLRVSLPLLLSSSGSRMAIRIKVECSHTKRSVSVLTDNSSLPVGDDGCCVWEKTHSGGSIQRFSI